MNIIGYVCNTGESFKRKPLNLVDSLILSALSNTQFENVEKQERLRDYCRAELLPKLFCDGIDDENGKDLLIACAGSPRFRDIRVSNFSVKNHADEQFAAVTFDAGTFRYVAFRGTDGSLAGWKEDFSMAYLGLMPAHRDALEYIRAEKPDVTGGHSKGGNLAVYAGYKAGVRKIHAFDSPGFRPEIFHQIDKSNITKVIPENTIVGMLLETTDDVKVIKSSAPPLSQHSPFSWIVEGDHFARADKPSQMTEYFRTSISSWVENMAPEKRKEFVEMLFKVLRDNGIETMNELRKINIGTAKKVLDTYGGDNEIKNRILELIRICYAEALKQIGR